MSWISLRVGLPDSVACEDAVEAELLANRLFELGAEGLEWQSQDGLQAVAAFSVQSEEAVQSLEARARAYLAAPPVELRHLSVESYPEVDWSTHWRTHFRPMPFGADPTLWVVPSWLEVPDGAQYSLRIDPSSAFGTGLHPTTRLCLEWILSHRPRELLDVGTGTGILALAAVRLGAATVVGLDNDPEALLVAEANRSLNAVPASVLKVSGVDVANWQGRFHTVMANILAGPLTSMAPAISERVGLGGELVLSGLLESQVEGVASTYESCGLERASILTREDWALLALHRPE